MTLQSGLTIAICTYNSEERIADCLKTCINQSYEDSNWEILVVDNNSVDNTASIVDQYVQSSNGLVRLIKEEEQGIAHARRMAIESAKYTYLSFIDDDCLVYDNWVATKLDLFEKHKQDEVGMISAEMLNPYDKAILPDHLKWTTGYFAIGLKYETTEIPLKGSYVYWTAGLTLDISKIRNAFKEGIEFCLEGRKKNARTGGEDLELSMWMNILGYKSMVTQKTHCIHQFSLKRLDFLFVLDLAEMGARNRLITERYKRYYLGKSLAILPIQASYLFGFIRSSVIFIVKVFIQKNDSISMNLISFFRARSKLLGSFGKQSELKIQNRNIEILNRLNGS